jgi:catechol 2,3-dioxygenase-like lactoylglutathione lyase family enzyme
MPLHRLTQVTMGVPDVTGTAAYYRDFGLTQSGAEDSRPAPGVVMSTTDGGDQLRIVESERRRLLRLGIGVDDPDDLERVASSLRAFGAEVQVTESGVHAWEPGTRVWVDVTVAGRVQQEPTPPPDYNTPGWTPRTDERAAGILREAEVRPRRLGHVVLGSTDQAHSQAFFTAGLGFKVSDTVPGLAAFMRCSSDHHNVLVQQSPVAYLHHTSWQVNDVDDVGRGATKMLERDPARHVWGLGRHHIGSNFFWYLRDPAGNFSEYYSDMDCVVDDAAWKPQVWGEARSLYSWGPPPPPSFLHPEDLGALMTGAHSQ